jgi:hypothetical protein
MLVVTTPGGKKPPPPWKGGNARLFIQLPWQERRVNLEIRGCIIIFWKDNKEDG